MSDLASYPTPSIRRRLVCMVYEAFLLFGVIFAAGFVFDVATQSRHALYLRQARMGWIFFIIGLYFVYFWSKSGQTLAMRTWRIQVVAKDAQQLAPLPPLRAAGRYVLSWLWFLPALAVDGMAGLKGWYSMGLLAAGFVVWALLAFADRQRQFLHDRLAGTRLIELPKSARTTVPGSVKVGHFPEQE